MTPAPLLPCCDDPGPCIAKYATTTTVCGCPAFRYRPGPCKHIRVVRAAVSLLAAAGYQVGGYQVRADRTLRRPLDI